MPVFRISDKGNWIAAPLNWCRHNKTTEFGVILDVCKTKDIIIGSHLIVKDQVNSVDSSTALFHYRRKNDPEVKL